MAGSDPYIRATVKSFYDLQQLRIQTGLRIVANWKVKLGQAPGMSEEDIESPSAKKLIQDLRDNYRRITDALANRRLVTEKAVNEELKGNPIITSYAEWALVKNYFELVAQESDMEKAIAKIVEKHPLWDAFLRGVRGCGPVVSAVILSEYDIHKAKYVGHLWKYAGLDIGPDGRGRGRFAEHQCQRTYTDKDGQTKVKNGITFNPFLKTKLIGVLGTSFVKQPADKCKYRLLYDRYKHRIQSDPKHAKKTPKHVHNMSVRYAVKMFLLDLYEAWRALEGLEVYSSYHEAKHGHVHTGDEAND